MIKTLVMVLAISGCFMLNSKDAKAMLVPSVSVTCRESHHYQMKATYPETANQITLSYYVRNRDSQGRQLPNHFVRDAANNTNQVYAGWYDESVYMYDYTAPVTVVVIRGNTLIF